MVSGGPLAGPAASFGIGSFLQNLFRPDMSSSSTSSLGTLWQSHAAAKAFQSHDLKSVSDAKYAKSLRVTFRNCGPHPLLLCWVDESGTPHHFNTLQPTDVVADSPITADDLTECTWTGHAFLLAECDTPELFQEAVATKSLEKATVMGGYRATRQQDQNQGSPDPVHVVTIQKRPLPSAGCGGAFSWCLPGNRNKRKKQGNLRKRKKLDNGTAANGDVYNDNDDDDDDDEEWFLLVSTGEIDPTPLDTTQKVYLKTTVGGWPVQCETCWHGNDSDVKEQLERDLRYAGSCFPEQARTLLKQDTYIWVNRSLTYGKAACPTRGSNLCFHPDPAWLAENGCHVEKAKCVEMYDILQYCVVSKHWGPGGVLIHELSHAYHNKFLPEGYDNPDIQECYEAAMKEGLYDCVRVHGTQGPEARAYACQDAMEYFAELSTAFLGGLDEKEEYNKWYPFNRKQLKEHDPRAYALLKRLWKVEDC
jgi:hypothetical protein